MLEVLPIQTKVEQESACARCGVVYEPDCMAYHAVIDSTLTGVCQFRMDDEGGHIVSLSLVKDTDVSDRDRIESLFVLGRATLNFIDLCGVHIAYFEDESFTDTGMIKSIGFSLSGEERWMMDLAGFFEEPCKCGK